MKIFPVISVTEDEIHNGILTVDNADTACYWFKRTLEGLTDNPRDKTARRYMDIANGKPDEDAVKFLNKLKYILDVVYERYVFIVIDQMYNCRCI